jgi:hypothetical protein
MAYKCINSSKTRMAERIDVAFASGWQNKLKMIVSHQGRGSNIYYDYIFEQAME